MTEQQRGMIAEARARHGEILPCVHRSSLENCFTMERGLLMFWFNDDSGSTRMISRRQE